ncbi:hypothetical protein BE20_05600 [Sorangium cellulosum]|nr:hypothetical protein BE20_05600 [Sorangium cellulosum]
MDESCTAASPLATCWRSESARLGSRARSRRTARSVLPSTSSIVKKRSPSASPRSKTRQTLGWEIFRASFSSRRKRSTTTGSHDPPASRTLTATSSSTARSRARHTAPMPPAPSWARSSNRPAMTCPGARAATAPAPGTGGAWGAVDAPRTGGAPGAVGMSDDLCRTMINDTAYTKTP